ncbi:hypothetical protein [uncultured Rhodospira sp.]|uniref:hypothetical protein n=1 Tax=uncultured Rhodospira sp. TaxID=1936189 RepID=UPI00262B5337|nr:hypothetical protein [uncultured Rhodospira sp.]
MSSILLVGLMTFINVAARAFQQLNVMHSKYAWLFPASLAMAVCEVVKLGVIVIEVSAENWWTLAGVICIMGAAGAAGSSVSMVIHQKLRGHPAIDNSLSKG